MTAIGLAILAVGVALVWAGIRGQKFGDLIHGAFNGTSTTTTKAVAK